MLRVHCMFTQSLCNNTTSATRMRVGDTGVHSLLSTAHDPAPESVTDWFVETRGIRSFIHSSPMHRRTALHWLTMRAVAHAFSYERLDPADRFLKSQLLRLSRVYEVSSV